MERDAELAVIVEWLRDQAVDLRSFTAGWLEGEGDVPAIIDRVADKLEKLEHRA